tara:strand:+ start:1027 stop:1146 length:120 start_codon:yes stop_codon:yes gene_type:complete
MILLHMRLLLLLLAPDAMPLRCELMKEGQRVGFVSKNGY